MGENLTTIAGPCKVNNIEKVLGTFGRASVPQRLKNQSLYHEILPLQKFNDISGKVLKPKKINLDPGLDF